MWISIQSLKIGCFFVNWLVAVTNIFMEIVGDLIAMIEIEWSSSDSSDTYPHPYSIHNESTISLP